MQLSRAAVKRNTNCEKGETKCEKSTVMQLSSATVQRHTHRLPKPQDNFQGPLGIRPPQINYQYETYSITYAAYIKPIGHQYETSQTLHEYIYYTYILSNRVWAIGRWGVGMGFLVYDLHIEFSDLLRRE